MRERANLLRTALPLAGLGAVLLAVPSFVTSLDGRFLLGTIVLYGVLAVSWNLTLGLAGIFNFAHIAFFAAGAYASAILTTKTAVSPWLGIPTGALVGALISCIAMLLVSRLRGVYVALITFIFSQLCFYVVIDLPDLTGGTNGVVGIPQYSLGGESFLLNGKIGYYYTGAALLFVMMVAAVWIRRSSLGRGLIALRDNEPLALSRGVPALRLQMAVFAISAAFAGATGAIYAPFVGVVSPDYFAFGYSSLVLSMIVLGGLNTIYGPLAGAVLISLLSDRLRDDGPWQLIVVSVVIIVVLRFAPAGLAGIRDWPGQLRELLRRNRRRPAARIEGETP